MVKEREGGGKARRVARPFMLLLCLLCHQVIRLIVACSKMAGLRRFGRLYAALGDRPCWLVSSSNEIFIVANMFLDGLGII